jgi:hypothetical protein
MVSTFLEVTVVLRTRPEPMRVFRASAFSKCKTWLVCGLAGFHGKGVRAKSWERKEADDSKATSNVKTPLRCLKGRL